MFKIEKRNTSFILLSFLLSLMSSDVLAHQQTAASEQLQRLERAFGGRIGVFYLDTATGKTFGYRETERFAFCSSFKAFLAAAVLAQSRNNPGLLTERVTYKDRELPVHSPVTEKNKSTGMTVGDLAVAALQVSDNGATNLLLERYMGGPNGMNAFMRSIGDTEFRLDRWEPELNSAVPGDRRDTSTPKAVAVSARTLALGDGLDPAGRQTFQDWLKGSRTGLARIRAGVPARWIVGDKTGTCGNYGTANDFAVIWPEGRSPIVLAIYTASHKKEQKHSDAVFVEATRIVLQTIDGR